MVKNSDGEDDNYGNFYDLGLLRNIFGVITKFICGYNIIYLVL